MNTILILMLILLGGALFVRRRRARESAPQGEVGREVSARRKRSRPYDDELADLFDHVRKPGAATVSLDIEAARRIGNDQLETTHV